MVDHDLDALVKEVRGYLNELQQNPVESWKAE